MYRLQSSCVDLAHKQYQNRDISIEELIVKLLTAETKLKEAVKYLLHEPMNSPEGRIAQMAMSELKMLKLSVINIQRDYLDVVANPRLNRKIIQGDPVDTTEGKMREDEAHDIDNTEADSTSGHSRKRRNRKKKKH